jgi:hypothetical protein
MSSQNSFCDFEIAEAELLCSKLQTRANGGSEEREGATVVVRWVAARGRGDGDSGGAAVVYFAGGGFCY